MLLITNDTIDGRAGATTTVTIIIWDDLEVCDLHYGIACFADDISLRRDDDTRRIVPSLCPPQSSPCPSSHVYCNVVCTTLALQPTNLGDSTTVAASPITLSSHLSLLHSVDPSPVSCIWSHRTSYARRPLSQALPLLATWIPTASHIRISVPRRRLVLTPRLTRLV